ncbi:MAG: Omp28-related outer membrane protein [Bacteroidota bacterium]
MKQKLLLVFGLFIFMELFAQSPRTVLIEHFTNTRCSICASRNPGFYSVLSNYPQVLHIAYHPSAPYSQCYFSLQNTSENDARTNYYNTYGSTPDYFLNGKLLPSANPAINNTTLDTAINQTSPIEIRATEELIGSDSVKVVVVVKTTEVTSVSTVRMFAGVAEEPVNYNAQNGETVHHDVFRKALTAAVGNQFALPALNDSVAFEFTYAIRNDWNVSNIYTLVLVQREDTKGVLNAAKSVRQISTSVFDVREESFSVYPNPFNAQLTLDHAELPNGQRIEISDVLGRKFFETVSTSNPIVIKTTGWAPGVYFIRTGSHTERVIKE